MKHENAMHMMADALVDQFNKSTAVNYIQMTFDGTQTDDGFVLTMQKKDGLAPCEKLAKAELINDELVKALKLTGEWLADNQNIGTDGLGLLCIIEDALETANYKI